MSGPAARATAQAGPTGRGEEVEASGRAGDPERAEGAGPVDGVGVGPVGPARRRLLAAAGVGAVGLAGLAAGLAPAGGRDGWTGAGVGSAGTSPDGAGPGAAPVFGILRADPSGYGALAAAGLDAVVVEAAWNRLEPEPGHLDARRADEVVRAVEAARAAGLDVVLGLGTQYPPAWVAAGPDGGRFVDQDGRAWRGPAGDDVVDAVFDRGVRARQDDYVAALARRLAGAGAAGVRLGGLARGELHYPFDTDRSGTTLWAYGTAAQERSPVPGLRPGAGTEDDDRALLDFYLDELAGYGAHQARHAREVFGPGPELLLLMPSWGLRPGEAAEAVAARLDGSSSGERRGTVTEGLDWDRQLDAVADVPGVAACTTWMDAEDQGEDDRWTSPLRHLHGLARRRRVRLWGENTGGGSAAVLRRCAGLVSGAGMAGMFWMGAHELGEDGNARLEDYADALDG